MLLLHTCCGPCLLYPSRTLERHGVPFTCYFFNHNIHPYREFKKRLDSFVSLCSARNYPYAVSRDYGLHRFLRSVVFREKQRCRECYRVRLLESARYAIIHGFSSFSTTLLYSRYQQHRLIAALADEVARQVSLPFSYHDFRTGWEAGQVEARSLELYRQKYCGCIFSEQERWDNSLKKRLLKERNRHV